MTYCLSQTQNRAAYYSANQLAQLRPSPRWTAQGVRPQRMYNYAIPFCLIKLWDVSSACNQKKN